jgi:hypothetical protein
MLIKFGLNLVFLKVHFLDIFKYWCLVKLDVLDVQVLWLLLKELKPPLKDKVYVQQACQLQWVLLLVS